MQIVDAHHHFLDPGRYYYPWMLEGMEPLRRPYGPEHLELDLQQNGVVETVVVQTLHDVEETRALLSKAAASSFVAGVVGWVDLASPNVSEQVEQLRAWPGGERLVGIRHLVHEEADPYWLCRKDVRRGLGELLRSKLPFDLLVRARELPAAIETAQALPDMRFVVDHVAKPDVRSGGSEEWMRGIAQIATCENVFCKVSGLVTETAWHDWSTNEFTPIVERAIEAFGFGRLMFGSDWPVCLLAASYRQVLQIAERGLCMASQSERQRFFATNARLFYGFGEV